LNFEKKFAQTLKEKDYHEAFGAFYSSRLRAGTS
jgi:hypothetical protein